MPYADLRLHLTEFASGYRHGRRSIISPYPIVALDALTLDGEDVDISDAQIDGYIVKVDGMGWGEEVRGRGLFGYGRRIRRGVVALAQTWAADATAFDGVAFTAPVAAAEGTTWLIGGEQVYAERVAPDDATRTMLIRGANGTLPADHAAGSVLYEVMLPEDVQEDILTLAKRVKEQDRIAEDQRGEGGDPFAVGLNSALYRNIALTFDRMRPKQVR